MYNMKTAYTIGNTINYDKSLNENKDVKKLGKEEDYPGGWVWKSEYEALRFIYKDNIKIDNEKRDKYKFSVYEIELPNSWEQDVSLVPDENGIYLLINDAIITKKVL